MNYLYKNNNNKDEEVKEDGPIEADTPYDQIQKDPYPLPSSFTWCSVNIEDKKELTELYTLLTENYVEDDDALFRFDYSSEFLKWYIKCCYNMKLNI